MGHFISESHQSDRRASGHPALRQPRRLISALPRIIRVAVAAAVALYFINAALASEDPLAMFVGLFPIAWIAVEFAWVALRPRADR